MEKCIAVCGDSFGTGSGLPLERCYEDSFGGQVASRVGLPLKVFARSASCNFTIFLQVKKVIEQARDMKIRPLVLVTLTHHSRLIFPIDGTKINIEPDISMVDYTGYPPYSPDPHARNVEFDVSKEPLYVTETISNLNLFFAGASGIRNRFYSDLGSRKWKAMSLYFEELYDDRIKMHYDIAISTMMHHLLAEAQIPHVIMGYGSHNFRFIKPENFVDIHWGQIVMAHPDRVGSGHCDEEGHRLVTDAIMPAVTNQLQLLND